MELINTNTGDEFSYSAGPNKTDLLELAPTYYTFEIMTEICGALLSTKKMITTHSSAPANITNNELVVYPNPVSPGNPLTLAGTTKGSQIQIFNRVGSLVKTAVATDSTTTLTLHLSIGMYVIRADNKAIQIYVTE